MNGKLALAVLMGIAVSGYAFAEGGDVSSSSPGMAFNQLDTDQDGALSTEEVAKHTVLAHKFGAADTDGDGQLGLSEFTAAIQKTKVANQ